MYGSRRIWTPWASVRKVKEGETTNDLFGFLTTAPNNIVGPAHPKAMPVILTKQEDIETWLTASAEEALKLQRPSPNDVLTIVARGPREPISARRPPVIWKIQARDIGLNALLANGVELGQAYFDKTLAGARLASLINRRFRLRPTSRPRSRHE